MLYSIHIDEKTIGPGKLLFKDADFCVQEKAKIGIIGRNGTGKTTLFRIISGEDIDYFGNIDQKKNLHMVLSKQEHFDLDDITPLDYVLGEVPNYHKFKQVIDEFPNFESPDQIQINQFIEAETIFRENNYWNIEERIVVALDQLGIDVTMAFAPFSQLSGGQKRFVELIRIRFAEADLILLDEPTNHMDYVGKADFIEWLKNTDRAVVVISHDRDVLQVVDEILELKDYKFHKFPGNYDKYLSQNGITTISKVSKYENELKQLENLHSKMITARVRKLEAKTADGRNNAKTQEERFSREYEKLKKSIHKPSFWIDQETLANTNYKLVERYEKYKDKNISIKTSELDEANKQLLVISNLSLGFEKPLFEDFSLTLMQFEKMQIKGRNGAGKTTLLKFIIDSIQKQELRCWNFDGQISFYPHIRLGVYEQEVNDNYLNLSLNEAILDVYYQHKTHLDNNKLYKLLAQYLFDPIKDGKMQIRDLSGGQKARFQIIKMLANQPNLLILDEPTNHLDLPSIEELERALQKYEGAILYVSHDSYFCQNLGGEIKAL